MASRVALKVQKFKTIRQRKRAHALDYRTDDRHDRKYINIWLSCACVCVCVILGRGGNGGLRLRRGAQHVLHEHGRIYDPNRRAGRYAACLVVIKFFIPNQHFYAEITRETVVRWCMAHSERLPKTIFEANPSPGTYNGNDRTKRLLQTKIKRMGGTQKVQWIHIVGENKSREVRKFQWKSPSFLS